jgi:hypothetical protein
MVRRAFLVGVMVGSLWNSAAIAQPPKTQSRKHLSVAERLAKPVKFEYDKTPLKEAVENLKELLQIPIVLDVKSLEVSAINVEGPISGKSRGGTALDDINDLLRPKNLAAEIRHDVLFVSTALEMEAFHVCRVYRLLKVGVTDELTKQIISKVARESWSDVGGAGGITNVGPKALVVFQTPAIHREIEEKFGKQLSRVSAPPDRIASLVPIKGIDPLAKMRSALRRPVSVEFPRRPLHEILESLAKEQKLLLDFDGNALAAANNIRNAPVAVNLKEIPLESIFALVLNDVWLAWTVDGERLLITTPQVARGRLITINYDMHDMIPDPNFTVLIRALTGSVQPDSWSDAGGLGKISTEGDVMSITQTVQVHRAIETWLADLRTALKPVASEK